MTTRRTAGAGGRLVAVDGVDSASLLAAARALVAALVPRARGGISHWDASGLFGELTVDADGVVASPRTLLLLYASDLAFRLRWEIGPALAEGRTVVAAPYVGTAVAVGHAAGVPAAWLANLFRFAARPAEQHHVAAPSRPGRRGDGFVEFACRHGALPQGVTPTDLMNRAAGFLRPLR